MPKIFYQQLLLFTCTLFFSVNGIAQDFQGEATYITKRNFSFKMDDSRISEQQKKMISERLKRFSEITHTLVFNRTESVFQQQESLEPQLPNRQGVNIRTMGNLGNGGIMYVNLAQQQSTHQIELMGKYFLVEDELFRPQWKMTQESKQIGNYTCYKATYTLKVRRSAFQLDRRPASGKEPPMEEEDVEVVAWYTPQIPVSFGPNRLTGLPGLILELNDGRNTTLCTKVVINPEKKKEIKAPSRGKKIDQKSFEEIQFKQLQEMRERRNNSPNRGDRIIIRG